MPTNEQLAANPFPINDLQRTQTKSPGQGRGFSLQLVPETGVEPATYALRMREHLFTDKHLATLGTFLGHDPADGLSKNERWQNKAREDANQIARRL